MAKVLKPGKKALPTKETMPLARNKAKASIAGLMGLLSKETGLTTKLKVSACIFGRMVVSVTANG